ncbi:prolipoprotein diacylglyceryl transferase family protein [Sorangium sp. So ce1128]
MAATLDMPAIVGDPGFAAFPIAQGLGLLLAAALLWRRLLRLEPEGGAARALRVTIAMMAGSVLGGALLGVALRIPRAVLHRVDLFAPGWPMAYGALAGAAIATALAARVTGAAPRAALDALAPALGVLVAIGRIGCFLAGCCFGAPSDGPFAVAFPRGTPAHAEHVRLGVIDAGARWSHPVHAAPLYEALVGVAMIGAGLALARSSRRGVAFAAVALLYAAGRFAVELLRADPRPAAGPLTLPQWLSLIVVSLVAFWWARTDASSRKGAQG